MCFSATASFVAGGSLSAIGGVTIKRVESRSEIPFALIPLIFGIQQIIEGIVWISLGNPVVNIVAAYAFFFISHIFWPIWMPIAALLIEPDRTRKIFQKAIFALGLAVGVYFLYFMMNQPIQATIINQSISYTDAYQAHVLLTTTYVIATCLPCIISSHRYVAILGVATTVAMFASQYFYQVTFASVWCFFAAALSAIVLLHFTVGKSRKAKR